jgi:hypothetical protein
MDETVLKLEQIRTKFNIQISDKGIIAESSNGIKYKVTILNKGNPITDAMIANADRGELEELVHKVCSLLESSHLLQGKKASITFSKDQVELNGQNAAGEKATVTRRKTDWDANINETYKIIRRILPSAQTSTSHKSAQTSISHKNAPIRMLEINSTGNCLVASLHHQMRMKDEPDSSPDVLKNKIKLESDAPTVEIRGKICQNLKVPANRLHYVRKIQTDSSFARLFAESFRGIQENDSDDPTHLFGYLRNKTKYHSVKSIDFTNPDLDVAKLTEGQLDVLLQLYSKYIRTGREIDGQTRETYTDLLFLHMLVEIEYKNIDPKEQYQVMVLNGSKQIGYQIDHVMSPPLKKLDEENLDKVLFLYYTGHAHYKSPVITLDEQRKLIRKEQDKHLNGFFDLISQSRGVGMISDIVQAFELLEYQHPIAYETMRRQFVNIDDMSPAQQLRYSLVAQINTGQVNVPEVMKNLGIRREDIQDGIQNKRAENDRRIKKTEEPKPSKEFPFTPPSFPSFPSSKGPSKKSSEPIKTTDDLEGTEDPDGLSTTSPTSPLLPRIDGTSDDLSFESIAPSKVLASRKKSSSKSSDLTSLHPPKSKDEHLKRHIRALTTALDSDNRHEAKRVLQEINKTDPRAIDAIEIIMNGNNSEKQSLTNNGKISIETNSSAEPSRTTHSKGRGPSIEQASPSFWSRLTTQAPKTEKSNDCYELLQNKKERLTFKNINDVMMFHSS